MGRVGAGGEYVPEARPPEGNANGLAMPRWLGRALHGGLPRGAVTAMANCPTALVDMLATVTSQGGCAAVVGYPTLALAAVDASGGDLERLVIVPDPAPHAGAVLGTLVEGLDMVLYAPEGNIAPTFARPVEARLRKSACALVVAGGTWPGARVTVDVMVSGVHGLGRGSGRVRGVELSGRVWGKAQPPQRIHGTVGVDDGAMFGDASEAAGSTAHIVDFGGRRAR